MKMKLPLIAAICCGLSSVASAFSLDFSGRSIGDALPITINVPGYGDVDFSPVSGVLEIASYTPPSTGSNAISFDNNEMIEITFKGLTPTDVTFQYIGVNAGESFAFDTVSGDPKKFWLQFASTPGKGDGKAGLQSVEFNAVPEPSTSLLGAIGCSLLVLRRRR
ncbi:PEP-CTERM sorting domain-containing protein [Akkermansiaceae bacterium]|nr:PEP-CTERM sorting domain-containing protein [Akkermansiaceae bacterium]